MNANAMIGTERDSERTSGISCCSDAGAMMVRARHTSLLEKVGQRVSLQRSSVRRLGRRWASSSA